MANEFVARNGIISRGGFTTPHKVVSSGYQITVDDYLIECSGSFTVTLPTAVGVEGKHYIIKNNGSLIITIATTSSQTIDGVTSTTLAAHSSIQLISTGANWINVLIGDSNTLDGLDSTSFALTTSLNGTQNYLTKYGATGITQSNIYDNGSRVQIGSPLRVNSKTFYNVAQRINNTGNETGTIYIEMPFGWTNNMGTYEIDIYNYNINTKAKIIVSGYNYSSSWINTSLQILGNLPSNVVRLGYNTFNNTNKCCILIGNTNSVWSYPQVYVSKVTQGYTNTADWSTGWSISIITDETNITNIVQPTANVGMMLDGKHASDFITPADFETNQLYPPTLNPVWYIVKSNGTTPSGITKTSSAITLEYGYRPSATVQAKWTKPSGYNTPERSDGLCGTYNPILAINTDTNPAANLPYATNFAPANPTVPSKSVIVWNIYADKKGITVSGNKLIMPTGEISASASLSVTYQLPIYYGLVTTNSVDEDLIKGLNPSPPMKNCSTGSKTFSPKINAEDTQYWVYAYPSAWGPLTNISNNDGDWSAVFTDNTLNITRSNTLLTTQYIYYITVWKGAFKNKTINFS